MFLLLLILKRDEFIIVIRITDSKVYYWSSIDKEKSLSHNDFEKEWSGMAMVFENIDEAGDPNYRKEHIKGIKKKIFNYYILGCFVFLLTVLMYISWASDRTLTLLTKLFLFSINIVGCYISYILIRQEKHQSDTLMNKYCKIGKYIDCRQVHTQNIQNFLALYPGLN